MKVLRDFDDSITNGTSYSGVIRASYRELVDALGLPTYNEPSGDNKTQVEWVIEYKGDIYTIYDWKTYDLLYTLEQLDVFHIGSKRKPATDFIVALNKKI
jgi:hypothetical protein